MKQLLIEFLTVNNLPENIDEYKASYNEILKKLINKYRLKCKRHQILITSQRIIINFQFDSPTQLGGVVEIRGPERSLCYDHEGNKTSIYVKFLKQKSTPCSEVDIKKHKSKDYVFIRRKLKAKPISDIAENFIRDFYLESELARKIVSILVVNETETLVISVDKTMSSNTTLVNDEQVIVNNIKEYFEVLQRNQIEIDEQNRQAKISNQIEEMEELIGQKAFYNDLTTLAYLSERPKIYQYKIKKDLLALPYDILKIFVEENPRLILFEKGKEISETIALLLDEDLAITTINSYAKALEESLVQYNELYLRGVDEDFSKTTDSLKNTVFLEDLGTMFDKVQRVKRISMKISDLLFLGEPIISYACRAAELSKTDLTHRLVIVHPKLHGIVGKNYALKWGEKQEVAQALSEYLLPINRKSQIPQTMVGSILSIADKIDTIVGLFSVGLVTKNSDDPYKIKSKADGIIKIIEKSQMDISLKRITNLSINLYESYHILKQQDKEKILKNILEFFSRRIYRYLENLHFEPQLIKALLGNKSTNITLIKGKGDFLRINLDSRELCEVTKAFTRLRNLVNGNENGEIELEFLAENQEKKFYENFLYLKKHYYDKIDRGDFESAFHDLVSLSAEVDKFLNQIYVHTSEEALRINRINMLFRSYELFYDFCDFSKLRKNKNTLSKN